MYLVNELAEVNPLIGKWTITGKWEVKDKSGNWNYWYDKVLTRIA